MSLTLDEVAQIRFRMARRNENGYKVTDVDLFIDKVEETFRQFENERDLNRSICCGASRPNRLRVGLRLNQSHFDEKP